MLAACAPRPQPVKVLPAAQREELRYHIERIEHARRRDALGPLGEEYLAAWRRAPQDPRAQILAGWSAPDPNDAFARFQAALKQQSGSYWAHLGLGRAYLLQGVLRRAQPHLERAVEVDPALGAAQAWHGELLRQQGKRDQAMAAFQRAVERDARSVVARRGLAELYLAAGNRPGAIRELQHVAEQSPRDLELHISLGDLLAKASRPDEALRAYEQAVEIHPNRAEIWFRLGEAAAAAGKDPRAEQAFRRVLELSSDDVPARMALGAVLTRTGRAREGIDCFRTVLAATPDDPAALEGLVGALIAGQRLAEALQTMLELERLRREPSAPLDAELRRLGLDRTPIEGRSLQQVFDRVLRAIHHCHQHLAGDGPAAEAKLVAQVEINAEGRATGVTLVEESAASAELFACLDWLVRLARFPKGQSAGVTFPVPLPAGAAP